MRIGWGRRDPCQRGVSRLRLRTCGQEWRKVHSVFDWLGAKHGCQFEEVAAVGQTGIGEGYALLCEDGDDEIKNRGKSVSADVAEKPGVLQPV